MTASRRRTVGLYGLTVVLNGAISLVTIPIVVASAGADHWASLATGQSIGGWFAVLVIFGWGLTGPTSIAAARVADRPTMFLDSLLARGALLVPVLIAQSIVTAAIVPHEKLVALIAGAAMTLAGASANWYFTGEGRAGRFLLLDTVPRVAGTITGMLLLLGTGQLLLFALAQLAGSVAALAVSAVVILRRADVDVRGALRGRRILTTLLEQRHGVVATGLFAAFTPAVLAIVAVFMPAALPMFVLADRLAKFAGMAVSPLFQMFQGWVPRATGLELVRRIRVTGLITLATAVAAGVLYGVLLPYVAELLAHGQIVYTVPMAIAFAVLAAAQLTAPFLSTVALMAVGRLRLIALSAAIGVPASLGAFVLVELLQVPDLAVWTIVAGNLAVLLWQGLALRRELARITLNPAFNPAQSGGLTQPLTARKPVDSVGLT